MAEPLLTDIEKKSPLWLKIKAHMEGRIAALDRRNRKDHDERKTARLRGGIEELEYLVSLDAEKPKFPPDDDKFRD